jgi:hypothetical protein
LGFSLQSFVPLAQPYAVSDAFTLWTLGTPSARPLDSITFFGTYAPHPATVSVNADAPKMPLSSGLCSTQESVATAGGLDRRRYVALLGFIPSRVFSLAGMERPSPLLPSWSCLLKRERPIQLPYRVLLPDEIGLSPKRLPTLLGFLAS